MMVYNDVPTANRVAVLAGNRSIGGKPRHVKQYDECGYDNYASTDTKKTTQKTGQCANRDTNRYKEKVIQFQ